MLVIFFPICSLLYSLSTLQEYNVFLSKKLFSFSVQSKKTPTTALSGNLPHFFERSQQPTNKSQKNNVRFSTLAPAGNLGVVRTRVRQKLTKAVWQGASESDQSLFLRSAMSAVRQKSLRAGAHPRPSLPDASTLPKANEKQRRLRDHGSCLRDSIDSDEACLPRSTRPRFHRSLSSDL